MDYEMDSFVAICKAANPDIAGASFEEFQDEHEVFGIVYTSEVCEALGLTRKFRGDWEAMPKLYELLAEHAMREHDDSSVAKSTQAKGFDDPDLLRSILATAGLEERDGDCAFTCNVLKVLGLVVGGPRNNSWKPTPRLRNLMISRLVRSLNVRASHPKAAEVDDRYYSPDDSGDGEEENPYYSSEDNRPKSRSKRRNRMGSN